MRPRRAPLLAPVLGLAAAISFSIGRAEATLLPAVVLIVVGLSGVPSRPVWLALGVGWALGTAAPKTDLSQRVDPERPVEVVGRPRGSWIRSTNGWHVAFEARSLRQGASVDFDAALLELWIAATEPPDGRQLRARGYLRLPRLASNGRERGARRALLAVGSTRLLEVTESRWAPLWRDFLGDLRSGAERRLAAGPWMPAALARALLLGDAEALPTAWLLTLRRLGLAHLIAVSGLHVGLAAGLVWLVLTPWPPERRWGPVALSVGLYLALVGPRPSLLRASVMSLVAVAALITDRRPAAGNAWAVAVGGMLVWRPSMVLEVGLQLTAAATLGLIWLAPVLARRWRRWLPAWLALPLAASVAAHLFTLPWSVGVFSFWSPLAIVLNLVAVPWTALVLALSIAALLLGVVPLAGCFAWVLLEGAVAPFAGLAALPVASWASRPTTLSPWLLVAIAAVAAWSLARARPGVAGALLLASAGWVARGAPALAPTVADGPEAVMIDVGQGEAILLRQGSQAVLVDGGGWHGRGIGSHVLLPTLVDLDVRRLDAVVLTHPDRDHCAGLEEIVHLLPVEELWTSLGWQSSCYRRLVERAGVRLRPVWRGVEKGVGGWRLEVLHPPAGDRASGNERSLVVRASAPGLVLLLTGDVGAETERVLLRRFPQRIAADVLKLGHHGSRHSSSDEFLDQVRPRAALVSAGEGNVYGHPSAEVRHRLEERSIDLYRTDQDGLIRLRPSREGRWEVDRPWRRTATQGSAASGLP